MKEKRMANVCRDCYELNPMKKHTNIDNEITGAYYKKPFDSKPYFYTALVIAGVIVGVLLLADTLFGAETVTNVLADLITY